MSNSILTLKNICTCVSIFSEMCGTIKIYIKKFCNLFVKTASKSILSFVKRKYILFKQPVRNTAQAHMCMYTNRI